MTALKIIYGIMHSMFMLTIVILSILDWSPKAEVVVNYENLRLNRYDNGGSDGNKRAFEIFNKNKDISILYLKNKLTVANNPLKERIIWILGEMKDKSSTDILLYELKHNDNESIKIDTIDALVKIQDRKAVEPLIKLLYSNRMNVCIASIKGLSEIDDIISNEHIKKLLMHNNPEIRSNAIKYFAKIKDDKALEKIRKCLNDKDNTVRIAAIYAIGENEDTYSLRLLLDLVNSNEGAIKLSVITALGKIKDPIAVEPLLKILKSNAEDHIKELAMMSLSEIKDERVKWAFYDYKMNKNNRTTSHWAEYYLEKIIKENKTSVGD